MTDTVAIPKEQFYREIRALRDAFGLKSFWSGSPASIANARHALCVCYFNTKADNDQEQRQLATIFDATLREFTRRGEMMGIDIETGQPL